MFLYFRKYSLKAWFFFFFLRNVLNNKIVRECRFVYNMKFHSDANARVPTKYEYCENGFGFFVEFNAFLVLLLLFFTFFRLNNAYALKISIRSFNYWAIKKKKTKSWEKSFSTVSNIIIIQRLHGFGFLIVYACACKTKKM